ncbi:MAG: glutathione S-transferase family protein [Gammaproteobacteria bacterium]
MGLLVDGTWHDVWYDTKASQGRFVRTESQFRNWITPDGAADPSGRAGFRAEPGRYHLYVAFACPWAHRTLIMRQLKGLDSMISVSATNSFMGAEGWTFAPGPETIADDVNHAQRVYELYTIAEPQYSGRATVPILWDKHQRTIVSNESAEIVRMLNSAFDKAGANDNDYYPPALRADIDEWNAFVYPNLNNGVYRAGFATTQEAYEEAATAVFTALDKVERQLSTHRYLTGSQLTEADVRLFTTLIRFDPVYHGHFKCNLRRVVDYPNIWGYVREIYQLPGIGSTVHIDFIKRHYYGSHPNVNPTRIVPIGPKLDYLAPHHRDRL